IILIFPKNNILPFCCPNERWEYFNGSFYYISSTEKTWQQSRDDCLQKGADLVIINSKEEQVLVKFKKRLWIGLTDSEREGTWKWVDGTPLTTSYWMSGEPNDVSGEDCVEILNFDSEKSWNDRRCSLPLNWICEMKVQHPYSSISPFDTCGN
uniref:C-type lectin domain-containing protein n=1 Tax=Sander lucioperca TaxID=283035 RepID=A0A8C9ZEZ8_SANLU